jgi:4'-phosphopantetheinyl transferase EntD
VIADLLPAGVASAELFADPPGLQPHPGEMSLIERAVPKRKAEFAGARHCARVAMTQLGVEPVAVGRGERGMPLFPRGVVGSLTHCDGYRAAALAHALQVRTIGIDAEPNGPLPNGVLDSVSLPEERAWLQSTDGEWNFDRLLFCAKEATYKAWFPLTNRWLGFEDAHITFVEDGPGLGTFHSRILIPGQALSGPPVTEFQGRWKITGSHILAVIAE